MKAFFAGLVLMMVLTAVTIVSFPFLEDIDEQQSATVYVDEENDGEVSPRAD